MNISTKAKLTAWVNSKLDIPVDDDDLGVAAFQLASASENLYLPDFENFSDNGNEWIGLGDVLGYQVSPDGVPFYGARFGGDWEMPIVAVLFEGGDGRFEMYVPRKGNAYDFERRVPYFGDTDYETDDEGTRPPSEDFFGKTHDPEAISADIFNFLDSVVLKTESAPKKFARVLTVYAIGVNDQTPLCVTRSELDAIPLLAELKQAQSNWGVDKRLPAWLSSANRAILGEYFDVEYAMEKTIVGFEIETLRYFEEEGDLLSAKSERNGAGNE